MRLVNKAEKRYDQKSNNKYITVLKEKVINCKHIQIDCLVLKQHEIKHLDLKWRIRMIGLQGEKDLA